MKADESLVYSDKTWQFLQTCILTLKNQLQLLSRLSIIKYIVSLYKDSTVIFLYLFSSALLISLNYPFICVLIN
jgi:hypothetical protein